MDYFFLLPNGIAQDEKGKVSFVNGFSFSDVKSFYLIAGKKRFIRAWLSIKIKRDIFQYCKEQYLCGK
jgi:hypothetical protein